MKQLGTWALILGVTFALGLSLASLSADTALAGPGGPPPSCNHGCSKIICTGRGQCDYGYVEKWRFWWDTVECIGLPCDQDFIGCSLPC